MHGDEIEPAGRSSGHEPKNHRVLGAAAIRVPPRHRPRDERGYKLAPCDKAHNEWAQSKAVVNMEGKHWNRDPADEERNENRYHNRQQSDH